MSNSSIVDLSAGSLSTTAKKYRKELLKMPIIALENSLKHMTLRPGIRYQEVVGELSGDLQFGPYSDTRVDASDVVVNPRTLETYFGSVVKTFKPNSVYQSIWGSEITKGEGLKNVEITRTVLAFLAAKLGQNLNKVLWSAVRNAGGSTSADLFNGFDTITAADITAGNVAAEKGNLYVLNEAITANNAYDVLKDIYRHASDELREQDTKLFIDQATYDKYVDDYQATVGAIAYNREFDKLFVEGSGNRCQIVPLANKKNSPYFQLTTKNNMLVGVNQTGEEEKMDVEKYAPFVLTFVATMFFGVQYESVSKERFLAVKLKDGSQSGSGSGSASGSASGSGSGSGSH